MNFIALLRTTLKKRGSKLQLGTQTKQKYKSLSTMFAM